MATTFSHYNKKSPGIRQARRKKCNQGWVLRSAAIQCQILDFIHENPWCSAIEIIEKTGIASYSVYETLRVLTKDGLTLSDQGEFILND